MLLLLLLNHLHNQKKKVIQMKSHIKLKTVSLKKHSEYDERWLHNAIAEDPSILRLGDVIVKDRERIHTGAGRLDILLQETDGHAGMRLKFN
jgi:hypothetical protein